MTAMFERVSTRAMVVGVASVEEEWNFDVNFYISKWKEANSHRLIRVGSRGGYRRASQLWPGAA